MTPPSSTLQDAGKVLGSLTTRLEELRRAFARYFDGLERTPPLEAREALRAAVLAARGPLGNNTGLLYRYQVLKNSWTTYDALFARRLAQIEAGTFAPHRARAAAKAPSTPAAAERAPAPPSATAATAPAGASAATTTAASAALARLHEAYAAAANKAGAPVPSREALAATLAQRVQAVRAESGQRGVDVAVVVEQGVPVLRVTPKPR